MRAGKNRAYSPHRPGGRKGIYVAGPAIDYLKLQSLIAETKIADEELAKSSLHKKTIAAFQTLQPLVNFINKALEWLAPTNVFPVSSILHIHNNKKC